MSDKELTIDEALIKFEDTFGYKIQRARIDKAFSVKGWYGEVCFVLKKCLMCFEGCWDGFTEEIDVSANMFLLLPIAVILFIVRLVSIAIFIIFSILLPILSPFIALWRMYSILREFKRIKRLYDKDATKFLEMDKRFKNQYKKGKSCTQ